MRNTLAIARREIQAYFASPIAYLVTAAYLAIMGVLFFLILRYSREATMRWTFDNGFSRFFMLIMAPAVTMRLLAEEWRMGTIELLLTSPVRDWEVVVGKWLASMTLWVAMLSLTLYYPFILWRFGNPDPWPIATSYLGVLLLGGALLAIGVFTSSLTQNQIVAAVLGVGIVIFLWLGEFLANFSSAKMSGFLENLSLFSHYPDFAQGIIDSGHVVYYLSVIVAFLFLATRSMETRRWR